MTTAIVDTEPTYYDTVTVSGMKFELWREKWKIKRTTFQRWYARFDGQSESDFRLTGSDRPAGALGSAILCMAENETVANRIWRD